RRERRGGKKEGARGSRKEGGERERRWGEKEEGKGRGEKNFFYQAKDGMRDGGPSRRLGGVSKGQPFSWNIL
ncbi:hypothetical protein LKL54_15110, partial [Listeria monocytogenes ATCC 19115]